MQRRSDARADKAPREGLGGEGEAVVHVGEEGEELQEKRIDGQQFAVVHPRRGSGEEGVDGHDAERAEHDVAVDAEEGFQRPEIDHLGPCDGDEPPPVARDEQHGRKQHADPLGEHRSVGDTDDAHVAVEGEPEAEDHVDDVDRNGRRHRNHGVLHAREPAVEAEEQNTRRHGPDAGVEVGARHRIAVHGPQRRLAQRILQHDHRRAHHRGDDQRPDQHAGALAEIARPVGLRRQAARSHADERTVPVDEVEDRYADGQRSDRGGRIGAPMAGDGRRDDAHQRHGDIRDDVGKRDAQYFAIHVHRRVQR